ncbi:MAG: 4Fe-4S dicluster domain-containing protein [Euryarchaeota archaeon]|nr:4Fe-4S dicluster domain-containing protein [Euryarchaeota archaeon]
MSMIVSSLKNLLSKPDTVRYPFERTDIPSNNRGRVVWDMERCIWCRLCEKNCPTKAIVTDKAAKTQTITRVRCIQCRTCVDVCPTNTIAMEPVYSEPGPAREVHTYAVGMKKGEYTVGLMPLSERDETRLRKR